MKWMPWILTGVVLSVISLRAMGQVEERLEIAPLGRTVEVRAKAASGDSYILESQAKLMEGEEWAPLLQFRGGGQPRSYVDPFCGTLGGDARFFRLRRLLEAPTVEVSNFRLLDTAGEAHELYYQKPARAVVLVLTGTNLVAGLEAAAEVDRVLGLHGGTTAPAWVLSASATEARDQVAEASRGYPARLRVLQDPSHAVHRTLGTGRVPEVVLVSTDDWSMVFRGPAVESVDTGVGVVVSRPFEQAFGEYVASRAVTVSRMATAGGPSGVRVPAQATYSKDIAPLLLKSCIPCHAPGNIAPWAMTNYAVIQQFAKLIKPAVLTGEMPPWHADPKHQRFSNSKALEPDEVAMLVDWIDRGSPRGAGADLLAEQVHAVDDDWPLGPPDAVVSIPTQAIPANGVVDYMYLFAQSPFPSNVWLRAVSVKPGDRSVVHHCLVFKGGFAELLALQGGLSGFFAGYVPGMEQVAFPEGTGKLLKTSDIVVFQMHYTTSGKAATDRTQLGLYLAKGPPAKELVTSAAYTTSFTIPPGAASTPVSATRTFAKKSLIYELSPHMHFRGSRVRFTLNYPDGRREVLLNVPSYFFNWQALYRLAEPKEVPAGTVLRCEGAFDNSPQNRFNPDPAATVKFGEQSWEEMFIGYVNFAEVP